MTSPLAPLISLPPVGPKNEDEGEKDKILSRVWNQLLTGKNDVIVAIYDANMEIDIAAVTTIRRTIVGCISFAYSSTYPDFINLNHHWLQ